MFKPGDEVQILASGKHAVVTATSQSSLIETSEGVFEEAELHQAHPTVLQTIKAEPFKFPERERPAREPDFDLALRFDVSEFLREQDWIIDFNGHWASGQALYNIEHTSKRMLESMYCMSDDINQDDLREFLAAAQEKRALDRWVYLGTSVSSDGCSYCGAHRFEIESNGVTARLTGEPCPFPQGFSATEWELNVPSGRIVVTDDLRPWFPLLQGDDEIESVSRHPRAVLTSLAYAAIGMSHGFVGNTSPGIFKMADGKYKIANEPNEVVWNGEDWVDREDLLPFEGEQCASICTDLWWYSLADADELKYRAAHFNESTGTRSLDTKDFDTFEVKPGVYRFRHFDKVDRDSDDEVVYATFEWVREADPVVDHLKTWKEAQNYPHAFVQAKVAAWPTLYGLGEDPKPWSEYTEEQKLRSWQRVADHIFFVIGSGTEWHENGFPLGKLDPSIPDIDPPSFRQQFHWYPFAEKYGGLFEDVKLNPGFARFAFRVLESVISFGMHVNDGQHSRDVHYVKERMRLACKRYRKLARKYPESADPDYVWWLRQPGRADAWVTRFNLGPATTEKHINHAKNQRWIPEGTYAIEFDARKLEDGVFAADGYWANKDAAQGVAIQAWYDNEQPGDLNCFWPRSAGKSVPVYSVARITKLGTLSSDGDVIVQLEYDYGSDWMQDRSLPKGVREAGDRKGIRLLTKEEYEELLPEAERFFREMELKNAS